MGTMAVHGFRRAGISALLTALVLTGAACGDDDEEPAETGDAPEETTTTTEAPEDDTTTTTEAGAPAGETVEVTAVDYAFEDLPDTVEAGTTFSLTNASAAEAHELVAFLLPETETRSAEELLNLPEEELGAVFGGEPEPATVILAGPGQTDTPGPVVGDGSLAEPGRYVVACFIPVGADPEAYFSADPSEGPPQVEGGPPHFTQGMFAELTVE